MRTGLTMHCLHHHKLFSKDCIFWTLKCQRVLIKTPSVGDSVHDNRRGWNSPFLAPTKTYLIDVFYVLAAHFTLLSLEPSIYSCLYTFFLDH